MRTLRSLVTLAGLQSNPLNCKTRWGQTDLRWRKKSCLFKPTSHFFFFFFLEKPQSVLFNQHQVTVLCTASKGSWAVLVWLKILTSDGFICTEIVFVGKRMRLSVYYLIGQFIQFHFLVLCLHPSRVVDNSGKTKYWFDLIWQMLRKYLKVQCGD